MLHGKNAKSVRFTLPPTPSNLSIAMKAVPYKQFKAYREAYRKFIYGVYRKMKPTFDAADVEIQTTAKKYIKTANYPRFHGFFLEMKAGRLSPDALVSRFMDAAGGPAKVPSSVSKRILTLAEIIQNYTDCVEDVKQIININYDPSVSYIRWSGSGSKPDPLTNYASMDRSMFMPSTYRLFVNKNAAKKVTDMANQILQSSGVADQKSKQNICNRNLTLFIYDKVSEFESMTGFRAEDILRLSRWGEVEGVKCWKDGPRDDPSDDKQYKGTIHCTQQMAKKSGIRHSKIRTLLEYEYGSEAYYGCTGKTPISMYRAVVKASGYPDCPDEEHGFKKYVKKLAVPVVGTFLSAVLPGIGTVIASVVSTALKAHEFKTGLTKMKRAEEKVVKLTKQQQKMNENIAKIVENTTSRIVNEYRKKHPNDVFPINDMAADIASAIRKNVGSKYTSFLLVPEADLYNAALSAMLNVVRPEDLVKGEEDVTVVMDPTTGVTQPIESTVHDGMDFGNVALVGGGILAGAALLFYVLQKRGA